MGWFREWMTGVVERGELREQVTELQQLLSHARRELATYHNREQGVVGASANRQEEALLANLHEATRQIEAANETIARGRHERGLLVSLLEDARTRELAYAAQTGHLVTLERHNAAHQASNEWAVAHINMLTAERASLLSQMHIVVPVPALQARATVEQRGAPAQPFDTITPPAGPIATTPGIHGRPIPDGKTAGDVIARLRQERDDAATQGNLTPEELLRAGADIFEDLPFPVETPVGPFTEA